MVESHSFCFYEMEGKMMQNLRRNISICARVSEEERESIAQKMDSVGMSNVNEYLRKMTIYGYLVEIDMQPLNDISGDLSRVSNNLNHP